MAMSPMDLRSRHGGRRWSVSTYRIPATNVQRFWQWSSRWGGRWRADGRVARGFGVQAGIFGRAVCVIVWPPTVESIEDSFDHRERERRARTGRAS